MTVCLISFEEVKCLGQATLLHCSRQETAIPQNEAPPKHATSVQTLHDPAFHQHPVDRTAQTLPIKSWSTLLYTNG